jgi:hypothetical protein
MLLVWSANGGNLEFKDFFTAKNSKSTKIRDRSMFLTFFNISVFVFFEFFAVKNYPPSAYAPPG